MPNSIEKYAMKHNIRISEAEHILLGEEDTYSNMNDTDRIKQLEKKLDKAVRDIRSTRDSAHFFEALYIVDNAVDILKKKRK